MKLPVQLLIDWFRQNQRALPWRKSRTLYSTWVAEVMLQQTQAKTVESYYRPFLERFPSVARLAEADLQDVLKAWEGLGYYARARNLHRAARWVMEAHKGVIPRRPEAFGALPGVGEYILAAVMSMACGLPLPVVDGNVLRVISRVQGWEEDIDLPSTRRRIASELQGIIPRESPGLFNEALMELGALACLPRRPKCSQCPLASQCLARRREKTALIPLRKRGRPIPQFRVVVALLTRRGKIFVQKRPDEGHLGGLWEFPGGKVRPGESLPEALVRECREELGVEVVPDKRLAAVSHAYSHFRIRLHLLAGRIARGLPRGSQPSRWVTLDELQELPLPGANHKLLTAIRAHFESI